VGYGQIASASSAKHPLELKEYMNYVVLNFLPLEVILAALSINITGQRSNTICLKLYSSWMPVDLKLVHQNWSSFFSSLSLHLELSLL
jgi:hypothetical protein